MNRNGELRIDAGFDGKYGTIVLNEKDKIKPQTHLSQF